MNAENEKFYLTSEGLEELKKECEALNKIRLHKTHDEAPNVLESQDLNPEYLSFKEDLDLLESRLSELENVIKNAVIIEKPSGDRLGLVNLGAKVLLEANGRTDKFTIVGTFEANPDLGKISNESPVGKALMGRRLGDKVKISSLKTIYKIKDIKYN
ncbi:MAG: GreA/GreB family elongation factor [bacterium]|nr:GreA/GreB family elongation factor [bacterium]